MPNARVFLLKKTWSSKSSIKYCMKYLFLNVGRILQSPLTELTPHGVEKLIFLFDRCIFFPLVIPSTHRIHGTCSYI